VLTTLQSCFNKYYFCKDVDFVVDPRPLSVAEEKVITDFIRANKEKRTRKDQKAKKILKSKGNLLV
jgi:hypothetical protein